MQENGSPLLHCYRCIYSWYPRAPVVRICPRCKSKYWNIPKIRPVVLGNGLGVEEIIGPKRKEIRRLLRRYGVKRLRIFGSVRRREAGPESDVDLLVDWKKPVSLLTRVGLIDELERTIGRRVDLVSEEDLRWSTRPFVAAEAIPL